MRRIIGFRWIHDNPPEILEEWDTLTELPTYTWETGFFPPHYVKVPGVERAWRVITEEDLEGLREEGFLP